jgi:hypothetical protein
MIFSLFHVVGESAPRRTRITLFVHGLIISIGMETSVAKHAAVA